MNNKIIYSQEEDIEFIIGKNLTILEKQIDKCDKQALITAVNIQSDLSYYLYEKHIPQEMYFDFKAQLSNIIKQYLKTGKCKK